MPGYRLSHLSLLLLLPLLLLAGCATKAPLIKEERPPAKKRLEAPRGKGGEGARIPATQRPYQIDGKTYYPLPSAQGFEESGVASWYGADFHGRQTSCGETYNMHGLTAAHKTLPMDTWLLVKNLENDREVTVRVNDRGPFTKERILDLTRTAANSLGFLGKGTAQVRITALGEAEISSIGGVPTERFLSHPDFQAGDFYVQIGSFIDENNARRLRDRMLALGRKTQVSRFDRDEQTFFRVQVSAGQNLLQAREVEQEMEQSGFPDAFVIAQ
ncbi:MAG: septal ring lytic transglycosylase RlpA family protein [Desulfobulbaceae bacterium]|nr:septal ring lytic transglycosylase RlpA family protein [Desulfobulbaceae bacterium]